MKCLSILPILLLVAGCGSNVVEGPSGPEGPPGPQGPPGSPAESPVLFWGDFAYPIVFANGGILTEESFSHVSQGVYEIVFDVDRGDVENTVFLATGWGFELDTGENVGTLISVSPLIGPDLGVRVISVVSILDDETAQLDDWDAGFTLVVLGNL